MTRTTFDLYQAAFWMTLGGTIVEIEGSYPSCVFHIELSKPYWKIKEKKGIVDWRELKTQRNQLKGFAWNRKYHTDHKLLKGLRRYVEEIQQQRNVQRSVQTSKVCS